VLEFHNKLEYHNADVCVNSSNDSAILFKNLVKFGLVTPEFTKLNCVLQVSISTRISLTTLPGEGGSTDRHSGDQFSVLLGHL